MATNWNDSQAKAQVMAAIEVVAARVESIGSGPSLFRQSDYMHPDDLALIQAGVLAGQDASRVTAGIRRMHEDALAYIFSADGATATVVYEGGASAINAPLMSAAFNQMLWTQTAMTRSRVLITSNGEVNFHIIGWTAGHASIRTDGIWGELALPHPVPNALWEWSQSVNRQWLSGIDARINVYGENSALTDPVGFSFYNCNGINSNGALRVSNLRNTAFQFEACQNSNFEMLGAHYGTGWQPTEFGTLVSESLRYSPSGSVITIKNNSTGVETALFTSAHVGRRIALSNQGESTEALADNYGVRGAKWHTITAVAADGKSATISPPAPYAIDADQYMALSDLRFSFAEIRATTTAGSAVVTLSAPVSTSLVGKVVSVVGAGYNDAALRLEGGGDNLNSVVVSHSGNVVTLAQAARYSVSNYPIVFSPQIAISSIGARNSHASWNENDDLHFGRIWAENASQGVVPLLINGSKSITIGEQSKLHGCGTDSSNNFAGNFAAVVGSKCKAQFDGLYTHSLHSEKFGKFIFSGEDVVVGLRGSLVAYPSSEGTALFWLDPTSNTGDFRIRNDLTDTSPIFPNLSFGQVRERGSANWATGRGIVVTDANIQPGMKTITSSADAEFRAPALAQIMRLAGPFTRNVVTAIDRATLAKGDSIRFVRTDASAYQNLIQRAAVDGSGVIATLSKPGEWVEIIHDGSNDATALKVASYGTIFGTAQAGLVPPSGGGTAAFLRADGTWAAPSGGASDWAAITGKPTTMPGYGMPEGTEIAVTADTTITLADCYKTFQVSADVTITLPTAPPAGFTVKISANANRTATLVVGGTDTIDRDALVYPSEYCELQYHSSGRWRRSVLRGFLTSAAGAVGLLSTLGSTTAPEGLWRITSATSGLDQLPGCITVGENQVRIERTSAAYRSETVWTPAWPQQGVWMRFYTASAWSAWTTVVPPYLPTAQLPTTGILVGARAYDTTKEAAVVWTGAAWVAQSTFSGAFADLAAKPATLAGYGITNAGLMVTGGTGTWARLFGAVTASNTIYGAAAILTPFYLPAPLTLDQLGCEITTAGASGVAGDLCIYDADPATSRPRNLLAVTATFAADTTGLKTAAITGGAVAIPQGVIWLGIRVSGQCSWRQAANQAVIGGDAAPIAAPTTLASLVRYITWGSAPSSTWTYNASERHQISAHVFWGRQA